ncbi:MAG: YciI family protein [bacterium]|nr:YciI family protein [bacterium]
MPKFLLILRGDPADWQQRAPGEIAEVIAAFETWAGRLMGAGRFHDGRKLADGEGRVLAPRRDGVGVRVTDGPYGETKELVGGFHLIEADSYDHAVELCRDHPELGIGGTVEIRRLDPMGESD